MPGVTNDLDLFDVGLGADSVNSDGYSIEDSDPTLFELQGTTAGSTNNNVRLYSLGLDDPLATAQMLDEINRQQKVKAENTRPPKSSRDIAYDVYSSKPLNTDSSYKAKSLEVDLGDTTDSKIKANIAHNAMGVEIDAILRQAELEESKREEVVNALKNAGYSITDSNSMYNKINEEFKTDLAQLVALRRAQNRFHAVQPNVTATLARNLIAGIFGDPTAPKIDIIQKRIDDDIKNFKGADNIRTAMLKAVAQENPVFAQSRMAKLEERAANVVREGTKVLLDNQHTAAVRDALVRNYKAEHPDVTGSNEDIYQLALAEKLQQERKDIELAQQQKTRQLDLQKRGLDQELSGRTFRAGEAQKQRVFTAGENAKSRAFKTKERDASNAQAVARINLEYRKRAKELDKKVGIEDRRAIEEFRRKLQLNGIKYVQEWKLKQLKDKDPLAKERLDLSKKELGLRSKRLEYDIRKYQNEQLRSGVSPKRARAIAKEIDKFKADVAVSLAKLKEVNKYTTKPVKPNPILQGIVDGTVEIIPDHEAAIARVKPVLGVIGEAERDKDGYNSANHPKLKGLNLSSMTLAEVRKLVSKVNTKGVVTGAVGLYQFMPNTLEEARKGVGLPINATFSPTNQDLMATWLLNNRAGLPKFLASKRTQKDLDEFQMKAAKVWAGIPVPYDTTRGSTKIKAGQSYYVGVSGNEARITTDDFQQAALMIDTADPVTLTKAKALLAGVGTASALAGEAPKIEKVNRKAKEQEYRERVSKLIGNNDDPNVFTDKYEISADGRFVGGRDLAMLGLLEAKQRGDLNTYAANVVESYQDTFNAINALSKQRSDRVVKAGKEIDYVATLTKPIGINTPLNVSILNPMGIKTKYAELDKKVNALSVAPSISELLYMAYDTDHIQKAPKGDKRIETAKLVNNYLQEVIKAKGGSPITRLLSLDDAINAKIKIEDETPTALKWLGVKGIKPTVIGSSTAIAELAKSFDPNYNPFRTY